MNKSLLFAACLVFSGRLAAAPPYSTPKPGSADRKAIMDALRVPVQKELKKDIVFKVGSLRVKDGWAVLQGNAVRPDGTALGEKDLWGEMAALLRKKDGKWTVLHWGISTDTGVLDYAKVHFPDAPNEIFPSWQG
jgi:hypothetical protein